MKTMALIIPLMPIQVMKVMKPHGFLIAELSFKLYLKLLDAFDKWEQLQEPMKVTGLEYTRCQPGFLGQLEDFGVVFSYSVDICQ